MVDGTPESIHRLERQLIRWRGTAFKGPAPNPFFGFVRRKMRQGQEILGLEVSSLALELLPSFFVNEASHRIGEGAGARISGRL